MLHCADDLSATVERQETALPAQPGVQRRASRSSQQYDDVINTVRITAIKSSLRPTIIPTKQQTNTEGKSHISRSPHHQY